MVSMMSKSIAKKMLEKVTARDFDVKPAVLDLHQSHFSQVISDCRRARPGHCRALG
jgi:hypothetical protein